MVRRKGSKEALNGPVRRTTEEPAELDRSIRRSIRSKERDPNAPQRVRLGRGASRLKPGTFQIFQLRCPQAG